MTEKTKEELEIELRLRDMAAEIRQISDQLYAEKRVEKIMYGLIGLILVAVVGGWIALVVR